VCVLLINKPKNDYVINMILIEQLTVNHVVKNNLTIQNPTFHYHNYKSTTRPLPELEKPTSHYHASLIIQLTYFNITFASYV
jgi:hypothetical protein